VLVLGIDVGGTKAVCWLANERGDVLADVRGPGATLQAGGEIAVEHALRQVVLPPLRDARQPVSAICIGMAGVDRPEDAEVVREMLVRLSQLSSVLVVNDALIALEAGVGTGPGIVVVAGTGSIAYGRDGKGRAARSGGWGYVLGDEGSGYWLGRQALQAVMRAGDGRGVATSLTAAVLQHFGLKQASDLVHEVYAQPSQPSAIAALSGLVLAAAQDGDAVAGRIVDAGAAELTGAALAVAKQLHLEACPVLLSGGVLRMSAYLATRVTAGLAEALPCMKVQPLNVEPVAGAVRLAAALAEGRAEVPKYERRQQPRAR
jgi:N-acetylglucosamine kinase-like BadF-type ATPase